MLNHSTIEQQQRELSSTTSPGLSGFNKILSMDFKEIFSSAINDDNGDNNDFEYLRLFFFGNSQGCVKFERRRLGSVNEYFKQRFLQGTMNGSSVAVARKDLFYQHFVIDFDLKKEKRVVELLTREDFDKYVTIRDSTMEKYILDDSDVSLDNIDLKVEYFVYEIIYILQRILKLDWLPIYVLLKRNNTDGTFSSLSSGFHIEIPDLVLAYHDIDILCSVLRHFIPNSKLLDCPRNYSLFGSQKYPNRSYFPRYQFNPDGQIVDCSKKMTDAMAFDAFNITKELTPDTKVYGFKISHDNFVIPRNGHYHYEEDNTIPEYQKKRKRSAINDSRSVDKNFFYKIGYAYYNDRRDKQQSLYKYVILNPQEDFTLYKNVSQQLIDLADIIPNAKYIIKSNQGMRAYLRRTKLKMRIFSSPQYKVYKDLIGFNFTNKKIPSNVIDFSSVDDIIEEENNNNNNPFHPFLLKHVIDLSEMSSRLRDTTYYLMAIYILSEQTHCDESSRIKEEWVNSVNDRFYHIYWDLEEKIRRGILNFNKDDALQQSWAILALKILIVNNDVIKYKNESKFSHVRTALGSIKIPDVILWYLFNEYPYYNYNEDFYEIMSLYIPIIPCKRAKNNAYVWDSKRKTWKQSNTNNNSSSNANNQSVKLVTDIYPELTHIFNCIIPYVASIDKSKEEKKTITINSLISRIESFWSGGVCVPAPVPDIFLCLPDCWYVLGGNINDELIVIDPIPMYLVSAASPSNMDSYRIEELYNHINECPFIQNQIFPIINEILEFDREKKTRDDVRAKEETDRLRSEIDARTDFTNYFQDDERLQIELELNTNFTPDQMRTRTSCGNYVNNNNTSRDEYTIQLAETFWQRSTTKDLAKLVKTYVLRRVCWSYKMMNTIINDNQSAILKEYSKFSKEERLATENDRMLALAEIMRRSVTTHPDMSHQLSEDLEPEEMTPLECDCAVTRTLIYLLQTFSYDVASIRYVLGNCVLPALCYGSKLKTKQIHFFLGNTNCGKTQFLNVLLSVLGHVGGILSSHTAHHGSTQDRIHDLGKWCETARFWFMDEITRKPLNRQLINQITGNSPLFIRTNYSEGKIIQVAPSIFVFGNNKPQFNENCPALLSRCKYFVFRSQFHNNNGGREPYSFKYCKFPQTMEESPNDITAGMFAFILHAACHNSSSPFYLYDVMTVVDAPRNVLDSTAIYSPVIDIVKKLCLLCGVKEEPTGMIPVQRFAYLINNLCNGNILKWTKIASESDALNFISQAYVMSKLKIDDEYVTIFQGITETNVFQNDQKILNNNNN